MMAHGSCWSVAIRVKLPTSWLRASPPPTLAARLRGGTPFLREVAIILLVYVAYGLTKQLIYADPKATAFDNAWRIVLLENDLSLFHEAAIQRYFVYQAGTVAAAFNLFYTIGYWPIILPTAIFLYWRRPVWYREFRTAAMAVLVGALVVYALFPLAPPRFLPGFQDLHTYPYLNTFGESASHPLSANPYAAMPSVHFALTLVVSVFFWRMRGVLWKVLAVAYVSMMFMTIVVTGNHYIVDAVASVIMVALVFALARLTVRLRRGAKAPVTVTAPATPSMS